MDFIIYALLLIGLLGCFIPILPGIPLVYLALIVQQFFDPAVHYPWSLLVFLGLCTLIISLAQYIIPLWGVKYFGASNQAVSGALIGLVLGIFTSFLGPFGIIVLPFVGATLAEMMLAQKPFGQALKAGFGAVVGLLTSTVVEFVGALILIGFFIAYTY